MDPGFGNVNFPSCRWRMKKSISNQKKRALAAAKKRFPLNKSLGDGHRFFMT